MADKNGLTPQAAEELLKYKKLLDGGLISLEDYEAKKTQILEPNKKAEDDEKKEKTYLTACKQIKSDKVEVVQKGIEALQSINDWKDAKQKIAEAQAKLQELSEYSEDTLLQAQNNLLKKEKKKIQKKEKHKTNWKKHKKLWISLISVSSTVIVGLSIFLGLWSVRPLEYEYLTDFDGYEIRSHYEVITNTYTPNQTAKSYKIPSKHNGKPVVAIGYGAFSGWTSLENISIPDSVISIKDGVFSSCDSLMNINVDDNNTMYKSVEGNLYSKDGKTLIQYALGKTDKSFTVPDCVTSIGDYAFRGTSLTSIIIPDSVTSIGYDALWASNIKYASIPASAIKSFPSNTLKEVVITSGEITENAFCNYTSLTSITIHNSITSIGNNAFRDCSSLTHITIPNSVSSIGGWAFMGCTSLTNIVIPDSVDYIGYGVFRDCPSLTIYCEAEEPSDWDSRWNYSNCPVVWGYKEDNQF